MKKRRSGEVKNFWQFIDRHPWLAAMLILVLGFIATVRFSCDRTGIRIQKDSVEIPTLKK
jgi:hypothetical protein